MLAIYYMNGYKHNGKARTCAHLCKIGRNGFVTLP